MGSWGAVDQEPPSYEQVSEEPQREGEGSDSGSEGVQSGQWDPTMSGSMEWEVDEDPLTSI